ncbi:MAG: tRNA (N6-isopentenyl adenosine(37)-C2)-methylthiotransferase MiaB [Christensenellaceae bacterium]|jgi:tRNA-2-methylthio-N6-dimethylallyladenosine synthase|nr:tRNA (N6-isopentenyl adenosine(37)-C2)-methylthiotransferase MiaB [Christensenellaceae bacterium]
MGLMENAQKKFVIKTYGCQMNVNESGKIAELLTREGFERTNDDKSADIIVFNTCCVRDTAEKKIEAHIGNTKILKKQNKGLVVAVIGCMTQKNGAAESLKKKFPHIDIILGTHNIDKLVSYIKEGRRPKTFIEILAERKGSDEILTTTIDQDGQTAYINITYGCENFCSYCIVPFVRGKLISRPFADIEREFDEILRAGVAKRIVFLGQNVNAYEGSGYDFPKLLRYFNDKEGEFSLNFLSSHPKDFGDELISAIKDCEKVEKNIHLPLQSGCDKILKLMNRRYTVSEYETKINALRVACPEVHITTDIICGFPTETEVDFAETLETMRRIKFNAAFVFPYSRRSGTVADKLDGQLPLKVKRERATKLIKLLQDLSKA